MEIYYENTKGEKLNLLQQPYVVHDLSELADYGWNYATKGRRVTSFYRDVAEIPLGITVYSDSMEEYKTACNKFFEVTEYDVLQKKRGKLYFNNEYVLCNLISNKKAEWQHETSVREIAVNFVTDYPFWITEKKFSFSPGRDVAPAQYLDYPYDYLYDYSDIERGTGQLNNDHYADAHFRMIVYGPVVNPRILIGGYPYEVFTTVTKNEYLVIDSRAQTVIRVKQDGTKVDEFDNRNKEQSVFRKIPTGNHTINWSGDYGIDITLFQERSEPRWS